MCSFVTSYFISIQFAGITLIILYRWNKSMVVVFFNRPPTPRNQYSSINVGRRNNLTTYLYWKLAQIVYLTTWFLPRSAFAGLNRVTLYIQHVQFLLVILNLHFFSVYLFFRVVNKSRIVWNYTPKFIWRWTVI